MELKKYTISSVHCVSFHDFLEGQPIQEMKSESMKPQLKIRRTRTQKKRYNPSISN